MSQPPDDFNPVPGESEVLETGIRRILAPNPSPFTYRGTNTYLLGSRSVAVIDPGPNDPAHLKAILNAIGPGAKISHIIVTHSHSDHSPLARPLAAHCGAPILAFGGPHAGRSEVMEALATSGLAGGGEGVDEGFEPDATLTEGDVIQSAEWEVEVIHTPGHLGNHIALAWGDACFTADHVMGWSTSIVSPPDGDLTAFMASCAKLQARDWRIFYPGHGAPIEDPAARLSWLVDHRLGREASIRAALSGGPATVAELTRRVYTDVAPALLPAAERNVFAHLIDLTTRNLARPDGDLSSTARFEAVAGSP
ncbi:MBL fold metallo-hydrolase [Chachezhania antarctica]|uniref:MBL fold metallo-hydrolase n=1 Tax=Chachezhania antarctica TaxID=2340860 RepID=UPI000EADC3A8|nr:MBL fold metallo-hydrolase [Chachezhania antarctica]